MDKSSITAREWHVRKALPEDLPMIAEIEKLSFHRPWSFDSIESFYYRKTSDIYVWRDRNRISGYIIAEHVLDQAELHRIAMIPFIRKMGIFFRKIVVILVVLLCIALKSYFFDT